MDAFKSYWQFPVAKERQEIFSFLTECLSIHQEDSVKEVHRAFTPSNLEWWMYSMAWFIRTWPFRLTTFWFLGKRLKSICALF